MSSPRVETLFRCESSVKTLSAHESGLIWNDRFFVEWTNVQREPHIIQLIPPSLEEKQNRRDEAVVNASVWPSVSDFRSSWERQPPFPENIFQIRREIKFSWVSFSLLIYFIYPDSVEVPEDDKVNKTQWSRHVGFINSCTGEMWAKIMPYSQPVTGECLCNTHHFPLPNWSVEALTPSVAVFGVKK